MRAAGRPAGPESDVDPRTSHAYLHGVSVATAQVRTTSPFAVARDLLLLAKPRLSGLVMLTSAGGMWLAPGRIGPARAILSVLATAAVVGAANALNCYLERDVDAKMRRTRDRPLPAGRVDPFVALGLGLGVPVFAVPVLALSASRLAALLALVALAIYVLVYTPMKQRSTLALFVGAVPGALPPLIGWTSVTGQLDAGGLALFALLFTWQLPHFLAISLYLREDYARGGLRVFSLVHGERRTRLWIAIFTAALVPVSLLLLPLGVAGPVFGATALVLDLGLLAYALSGLGREGGRWARNFFLGTLIHLTALFVALFLAR
jgi:heme o synthase